MAVNHKYRTGIWLAILLSIAGLFLVFKSIPEVSLTSGPPRLDWMYLGLGFLVLLAVWLAKSLRMYLIGNGMNAKINFWRYFQIYMATCFISHVTPFNSGGTPLQIYLLHRDGITVGKSSAITVVDLGVNTIIFVLLVLIAVIYRITAVFMKLRFSLTASSAGPPPNPFGFITAPGLLLTLTLIVFVVGVLLVFRNHSPVKNQKWPPWLKATLTKLQSFLAQKDWRRHLREEYALFKEGWLSLARQNPSRLIWAIVLTLIYWLFYLSLAPLVIRALGNQVSFISLMGGQLLFNLVQILIPTPGGSGGSELIMSYLFRSFTGAASIGWFVLLWKIYTFFSTLIFGGYYFIRLVLVASGKNDGPKPP